jgi:isopenicillin N synthase-like dioxygenase
MRCIFARLQRCTRLQRPPIVEVDSPKLLRAAREYGCFYLRHSLPVDAVGLARAFFALPVEEKRALGIAGSPHFRGYSEVRNERDWREQIHFGREEAVGNGLHGPNLWPGDLAWRRALLAVLGELETVGRAVLRRFGPFLPEEEDAYLLLKLIHYFGSPVSRAGVAAHVDFSWITLLAQDETGGLEVCTPMGEWVAAPYVEGTLVVNLGEILQFATGGVYQATPHRVMTGPRSRVSLPFFLNPSLDRIVTVVEPGEHVHRVLRPAALRFGEEEWKRKGLGVWCAGCS